MGIIRSILVESSKAADISRWLNINREDDRTQCSLKLRVAKHEVTDRSPTTLTAHCSR